VQFSSPAFLVAAFYALYLIGTKSCWSPAIIDDGDVPPAGQNGSEIMMTYRYVYCTRTYNKEAIPVTAERYSTCCDVTCDNHEIGRTQKRRTRLLIRTQDLVVVEEVKVSPPPHGCKRGVEEELSTSLLKQSFDITVLIHVVA
jgi:hypothetical protein